MPSDPSSDAYFRSQDDYLFEQALLQEAEAEAESSKRCQFEDKIQIEPPEEQLSESQFHGEDIQLQTQDWLTSGTDPAIKGHKRSRTEAEEEGETVVQLSSHDLKDTEVTDNGIYSAIKYGDIGSYMRNKRAKFQLQNQEIAAASGKTQIFKGIQIYINGHVVPSQETLRKLLVERGGVYHPILDRKGMITHIIASNLTPAKVKEFRDYKVILPSWITASAEADKLLRWQDFIWKPLTSIDSGQGTSTGQQTLQFDRQDLQSPRSLASAPTAAPPSNIQPVASSSSSKPAQPPVTSISCSKVTEDSPWSNYAYYESNPHAQRLMNRENWAKDNTALSEDFLPSYFKNSRLHWLSTWKAELKLLVAQAQNSLQETPEGNDGELSVVATLAPGSIIPKQHNIHSLSDVVLPRAAVKSPVKPGIGGKPSEKIILHVDYDMFFVACGLTTRPELKGLPVVVCHSSGGGKGGIESTSEIACASYEARAFGVKGGTSLGHARRLCPTVQTIPYEFELYKKFSLTFYTILMAWADEVQAVSIDEALVDITNRVEVMRRLPPPPGTTTIGDRDVAMEIAETIRTEVRAATGCEVSIGVSHNPLLARLATRRAKPARAYHLLRDDIPDFMAPLKVKDFHGFGYRVSEKIEEKFQTSVVGELLKITKGQLQSLLGEKTGTKLYNSMRGEDNTPIEVDKERRSVSAEVNYGIRFSTMNDVEKFLVGMAEEVSSRLMKLRKKGCYLTLNLKIRHPEAPVEAPKFMGHGWCIDQSKSVPLTSKSGGPTDEAEALAKSALTALISLNIEPKDLRGVGIQVTRLESSSGDFPAPEKGQQMLNFQKTSSKSALVAPLSAIPTSALPEIIEIDDDDEIQVVNFTTINKNPAAAINSRVMTSKAELVPPLLEPADLDSDDVVAVDENTIVLKALPAANVAKRSKSREGTPLLLVAQQKPVQRTSKSVSISPVHLVARGMSKSVSVSPSKRQQRRNVKISVRPPPQLGTKDTGSLETLDDIRDYLDLWISAQGQKKPSKKAIHRFKKFLLDTVDPSVGGSEGFGKSIGAMQWLQELLKNQWAEENVTDDPATLWWGFFNELKEEMNRCCVDYYGGPAL